MKKQLLVLIGILFMISATAQNRGNRQRGFHERMKAEKVAFFTEKLDLGVEESKAFWPLYDAYDEKKSEISGKSRDKMRKLFTDSKEITEKDMEKMADNFVQSKVDEVNLLKNYHAKFKKVLSAKQVLNLYRVEDQYKSHLLNKIRGNRNQSQSRGGGSQSRGGRSQSKGGRTRK